MIFLLGVGGGHEDGFVLTQISKQIIKCLFLRSWSAFKKARLPKVIKSGLGSITFRKLKQKYKTIFTLRSSDLQQYIPQQCPV